MDVSVCMAVHNGARFLRPQLASILAQLRSGDEVIVVDDASTDDSQQILQSFNDPRVCVYRNTTNAGVLRTFERALQLANGEILFLSDQDDVWLEGKLPAALDVYRAYPEVTMVVSDAELIDEEGRTLNPSFYSTLGPFSGGAVHNFVKNKCLGCTMSFRRSMLRYFLPIPPDVPMHDIWFGVLNGMYGRTHFIDRALVAYRRHGRNVSPVIHASAGKMLLWRYRLAKNLLLRAIRA